MKDGEVLTVTLKAGQWRLRAEQDWPELLHIQLWADGTPYILAEAPRHEVDYMRANSKMHRVRGWPVIFCRANTYQSRQVKVPKLMFFPTPVQEVLLKIQSKAGAIERLKPPFPEVVGKAQMGCRL